MRWAAAPLAAHLCLGTRQLNGRIGLTYPISASPRDNAAVISVNVPDHLLVLRHGLKAGDQLNDRLRHFG